MRRPMIADGFETPADYVSQYQAWEKTIIERYDVSKTDVMRVQSRALNDEDLAAISSIKDAGNAFVAIISANMPAGRERSLAITNAEQAVMWAVKGVTA